MFPIALTVLVTLIASVAIVGLVLTLVVKQRPDDFSVARSTTVSAPPAAIFPHLNNLRNFQAWSPFADLDPNCQVTFEGPEAGPGARQSWSGNNRAGKGSLAIMESRPNELVVLNLVFERPFKCNNIVHFGLEPAGDQTTVSWSMFGKNNFMGKAMGLFINMDEMVGRDFARGLAMLKSRVETSQRTCVENV